MRARAMVLLAVTAAVTAACSGGSQPASGGSGTGPEQGEVSATLQDGRPADFDVHGHSLQIQCTGSGSPVVVLVSGLGGDRHGWDPLVPELASHTRVCAYDRAGLGGSEASDDNTPTAGEAADELAALLDTAGVAPPYVLVGHSYGGMIARVFAAGHPDDTEGLLLVDSAVEQEFTDRLFSDIDWVEAGVAVDTGETTDQLLAARDLGDLPLVVLTEGQMSGRFARVWTRWQADLAAISTNTVHVSADESGHFIQEDQPGLVLQGVADLVAAGGAGLSRCDDRYTGLGATCL